MVVFQLGSTLLDACVLAILSRHESYGYELTSEIKGIMMISESALYPVLRRLQKDGLLSTYDKAYQGRNRRYYRITPAGAQRSRYYLSEWQTFKGQIDRVMEGKGEHE